MQNLIICHLITIHQWHCHGDMQMSLFHQADARIVSYRSMTSYVIIIMTMFISYKIIIINLLCNLNMHPHFYDCQQYFCLESCVCIYGWLGSWHSIMNITTISVQLQMWSQHTGAGEEVLRFPNIPLEFPKNFPQFKKINWNDRQIIRYKHVT